MVERNAERRYPHNMVRDWYGNFAANVGLGAGASYTLIELSSESAGKAVLGIMTAGACAIYAQVARTSAERAIDVEVERRSFSAASREFLEAQKKRLTGPRAGAAFGGGIGTLVLETPSSPVIGLLAGVAGAAIIFEAEERFARMGSDVVTTLNNPDDDPPDFHYSRR